MRSANLFFFTQPQETFQEWLQGHQNEGFEEKEEPFFVEFQQIPINYGTITDTAYQDSLYWKEQHLYGSSRLGIAKQELEVTNYTPSNFSLLTSNFRNYELTNHLGNILATIKDEKQQIDQNADGIVDYYEPIVMTANDYYPFGMVMPNRSFSLGGSNYRFGFNKGSEKDDEIAGEGNHYTTLHRELDTRLGRWWSVDPEADELPHQSPYCSMDNNPILNNDPDGDFVPQLVGALIGGGVEIGTQMLSNYMSGKEVTDLNWKAVGVSTFEGALTAGTSAGRTLAVKAGAALVKSGMDYAENHDIKSVSDGVNIVKNAAIDMTVDKLAGGVSKVVVGKVGKSALQKVGDKAIISKTDATKAVKAVTGVSNKTATTVARKTGLQEGTKQVAKAIKEAPKTIGEIISKSATNEKVKSVKEKTDIKR